MNKSIGNIFLWLLLVALISNGAINVPRTVEIVSDKVGRIFVILISDTRGD